MKILYLTQVLSAIGGGGEVLFSDFAKGMVKQGHEVHIICHMMKNSYAAKIPGAKIHTVRPALEYKPGKFLSMTHHMMYVVNALIKGSSVIRDYKIDVIHANTFSPAVPASILGKIYNVPVIVTVHDVYTAYSSNYWKWWSSQDNVSHTSSLIAPIYEKTILRLPVTKVHVISNATREDVLMFNRKASIVTIYNGVDLESYSNPNHEIEYQKFVLYIGRLIVTKNLQVVISAFKDVIRRIPDAQLVIVGEGPMRNNWEKEVRDNNLSDNVQFRGFVTEEDKKDLLRKCSALVFPSLVEGFGLVVLEAFAMSKPVLAANVEPFDEIIEEGADGFLLPANDPYSWSEKITSLLLDKSACKKMGQYAKLKVQTKYDERIVHRKMEQLYTEVSMKQRNNSK
jgi:glycosyltransferase involved in cell wall biosynthesis